MNPSVELLMTDTNRASDRTPSRRQIQVHGIVQGVGFRPFVYHLAHRLHLTGYVLNTSAGVLIEIEGTVTMLDRFLTLLTSGV